MRSRRVRAGVAGACALGLVLGACGEDGGDGEATATTTAGAATTGFTGPTTYPLTIDNCESKETFTRAPRTVLTEGAPQNTALLIELGLKDRIVKTTIYSTRSDIPGMPAQLKTLNRVTVEGNGLPREEMIALEPDLVVAGFDSYFQSTEGFATRDELHAAGINAYAPAYFCAEFKENPSAAEVVARKNAGIDAHLQTIIELGQIFDVNDRAAALVAEIRQTIADTRAKVAGLPLKRMTITDPSIADETMSGGVIYVYGGKILDELLAVAGGTNVWADGDDFQSVSKEDATARPADVVVYGEYDGAPPPEQVLAFVKATFPSWPAAQTGSVVQIDDTVTLQVTHPGLTTLMAKALHPEAFS